MRGQDNGYSNFNNYDLTDNKPEPPKKAEDGSADHSPAFGKDNNTYAYVSRSYSKFGMISLILGVCGFCCFIPAVVGIVLSIIGLARNKRDALCWIGLAVCVAMFIANIVSIVNTLGNPKIMNEFMQLYDQML